MSNEQVTGGEINELVRLADRRCSNDPIDVAEWRDFFEKRETAVMVYRMGVELFDLRHRLAEIRKWTREA